MDLAIVHDYLTQRGGAERVVLRLAALFPGAPIYTSLYAPDLTYEEFRNLEVITSYLQGRVDPRHFRRAAMRYPRAFRRFDLRQADRLLVSSSAFAHHVRHPRALVYCYTPPRFLYDVHAYTRSRWARVGSALLSPLRSRDRRAANAHAAYLAISRATARKIRAAYGRNVPVVYPPLNTGHLPEVLTPLPGRARALIVSRLLPYKGVDVAVRACALVGIPLTVVGDGPDEARLRSLASGGVDFVGRLSDRDLSKVFASHSVILSPGVEDFGYAPIEANYAGRPVVALAAGGALETVQEGVTGRLVADTDITTWAGAIRDVLDRSWVPSHLRESTRPFSADVFEAAVLKQLASV
jgi:glycosyltransferase involved in cell wall biosynthesis